MRKSLFILICLVEKPLFGLVWRLYNFSSFGLEMCNATTVASEMLTCASHRLQTNGWHMNKSSDFLVTHIALKAAFIPRKKKFLFPWITPNKMWWSTLWRSHGIWKPETVLSLFSITNSESTATKTDLYHIDYNSNLFFFVLNKSGKVVKWNFSLLAVVSNNNLHKLSTIWYKYRPLSTPSNNSQTASQIDTHS